jgi:hypothetical protein
MSSMQRELLSTFELELGNFSVRSDFGVDRCSRGAREGDGEHGRSAAGVAWWDARLAVDWAMVGRGVSWVGRTLPEVAVRRLGLFGGFGFGGCGSFWQRA